MFRSRFGSASEKKDSDEEFEDLLKYGMCTLLLLHRYELSTSYHTVYLSQPHQYTICRNRT